MTTPRTQEEIAALVRQHTQWLQDMTQVATIGPGRWSVTTPHLDRHNDHLRFYVLAENGRMTLTDDGFTIADLESCGCNLTTPKRRGLLLQTLNGFGVQMADTDHALEVKATKQSFAQKMHTLVQAMLAVNDLFYTAEPHVSSLFMEDVQAWLNESEIRYVRAVKFTGKSGLDQYFDFVVPKSKTRPDRMLILMNRPARDAAVEAAFRWNDTRFAREENAQAYAIVNDAKGVPDNVAEALEAYQIEPVYWSRREAVVPALAA